MSSSGRSWKSQISESSELPNHPPDIVLGRYGIVTAGALAGSGAASRRQRRRSGGAGCEARMGGRSGSKLVIFVPPSGSHP
jgi:hypothetical protein